MFEVTRTVLGFPVTAYVTELDEGINILLIGGCRTHIGAVSLARPDGETSTQKRVGHKEHLISEKIADNLCTKLNKPVCVECGIHYDDPTEKNLQIIVSECDGILKEIEKRLERTA
jgi:hypothetical protein